MAKNNINTNFENLKAEMMKKKEGAQKTTNNTTVNVNNCEVVDKNVNIDKYDYTSDSNSDINEVDSSSDANISQNKIVIKKAKKEQPPKRITYYLKQDTIKKIERYSKLTGMGKSELVQTLLEISLNNLEVE
ncbi:MAG: hypothetical protein ACRC18_14585 [Cetobacterium sp.]